MNLLADLSGAEFSLCRTWRYALWRKWDASEGLKDCLAFLMLNPSTADEHKLDPTITRCKGFAMRSGYSGLLILNLFAYRATKPSDMKAAADPVGPQNDERLLHYAAQVPTIIAAWGSHGVFRGRAEKVKRLLKQRLYCLEINDDGSPKHPLYIKGDCPIQDYWEPPEFELSSRSV